MNGPAPNSASACNGTNYRPAAVMPARHESATPTTEASSSSEGEQDILDSLTRKQVLEISEAFETGARGEPSSRSHANRQISEPTNKRRRLDKGKGKAKTDEAEQAPGGFLVGGDSDDDDDGGGFIRDPPAKTGGGGFLLDDDEDEESEGGGGFVPAVRSAQRSQPGSSSKKAATSKDQAKSILLDRIPSVLESLGLDGDDSSILSIFENASFEDPAQDGLQAVKRKDFLKVTAILITQRDNEREQERAYLRNQRNANGSSKKGKERAGTFVASGGGKGRAVNIDANEVDDGDEHDDSDPLVLDSSDEDDEDDAFNRDNEDSDPWADEDEIEGAFAGGRGASPPSKRRTTRSRAKATSPLSSVPSDSNEASETTKGRKSKAKGKGRQQGDGSGKYQLSTRQREECSKMFQQFFAGNDKNRNQAISMAEIRYVATLLNEKISDEDVSYCCWHIKFVERVD